MTDYIANIVGVAIGTMTGVCLSLWLAHLIRSHTLKNLLKKNN